MRQMAWKFKNGEVVTTFGIEERVKKALADKPCGLYRFESQSDRYPPWRTHIYGWKRVEHPTRELERLRKRCRRPGRRFTTPMPGIQGQMEVERLINSAADANRKRTVRLAEFVEDGLGIWKAQKHRMS